MNVIKLTSLLVHTKQAPKVTEFMYRETNQIKNKQHNIFKLSHWENYHSLAPHCGSEIISSTHLLSKTLVSSFSTFSFLL